MKLDGACLRVLWHRARRVLLLSLLWALGVAAFELSGMPWQRLGAPALLQFTFDTVSRWTFVGVLVIAYGSYAVPRWSTTRVLLGHAALAPIWAAAHDQIRQLTAWSRADPALDASYAYLLWSILFYGVMFIASWTAVERGHTTRRLLASAEIARRRGEAELGRARLLALRGQVDPALVLDVMGQVQQRYRADPAAGDRLLDVLVAFLRGAMPAVRSGRSTLQGELALARASTALMRELDPHRAVWQLQVPERLPDLPFPPLLLLPVLEQLGAAAAAGAEPRLQVTADDDAVRLEFVVPGTAPALDASLAFRLRVGLQTLRGDAWSLASHAAGTGAQLVLVLPLTRHPVTPPARSADGIPPTHSGGPRWTMHPVTSTT